MRKILIPMLAVFFLAVTLKPASAQVLFSIAADVPVSYSFSNADLGDESASGLLTKVTLPFGLGFGFESYEVTGKYTATTNFEFDVAMIDIFYGLPVPVLNVQVGVGVGIAKFELVGTSTNFDDPMLTQLFLSVGYPFAGIFDVHFGYYRIRGEAEASGISTISLNSNMFTLGARIGF
ncbi:MAG: hypothetical protein V3S64_06040 [bacterium]